MTAVKVFMFIVLATLFTANLYVGISNLNGDSIARWMSIVNFAFCTAIMYKLVLKPILGKKLKWSKKSSY